MAIIWRRSASGMADFAARFVAGLAAVSAVFAAGFFAGTAGVGSFATGFFEAGAGFFATGFFATGLASAVAALTLPVVVRAVLAAGVFLLLGARVDVAIMFPFISVTGHKRYWQMFYHRNATVTFNAKIMPQSGANTTHASGGKVISAEQGWPAHGRCSASMWPALPRLLPP